MDKQVIVRKIDELLDEIDEIRGGSGGITAEEVEYVSVLLAKLKAWAGYVGINLDVPSGDGDGPHRLALVRTIRDFKVGFEERKAAALIEIEFGEQYVTLSQQEVAEIQSAIDLAREQITDATAIPEKHKERLLRRLEKVQAEIHKVRSDIDVVLAGAAEAGVVIGKFGEDAKPFADFLNRIWRIFESKQPEQKQLPPPESPQLPSPPKQLPGPEADIEQAPEE